MCLRAPASHPCGPEFLVFIVCAHLFSGQPRRNGKAQLDFRAFLPFVRRGTKWVRNGYETRKTSHAPSGSSEPRAHPPGSRKVPNDAIATVGRPAAIAPVRRHRAWRRHGHSPAPRKWPTASDAPAPTTMLNALCSRSFATNPNFRMCRPSLQIILSNSNRRQSPNCAQSPRWCESSNSAELDRLPATSSAPSC